MTESFITSHLKFKEPDDAVDYKPPPEIASKFSVYSEKTLRISENMFEDIETLCDQLRKHPEDAKMTICEFIRRSIRPYIRCKNVVLSKNKKSTTKKEKLTKYVKVKKWESGFPADQKLIREIIAARIKEEKLKLQEA